MAGRRLGSPGGMGEASLSGLSAAASHLLAESLDLPFLALVLGEQTPAGGWSDVTTRAGLPAPILNGSYNGAWTLDVDLTGNQLAEAVLGDGVDREGVGVE